MYVDDLSALVSPAIVVWCSAGVNCFEDAVAALPVGDCSVYFPYTYSTTLHRHSWRCYRASPRDDCQYFLHVESRFIAVQWVSVAEQEAFSPVCGC